MLTEAWPKSSDIELILGVDGDVSVLFHGTMCAPLSTLLRQEIQPLKDILRMPSPGSHPVLIARKLLLLATYLQGLPPSSVQDLGSLSISHLELMSSIVELVHNQVTCNDQLLESIESVECLMIESMYQNNAGNLRSAWTIIRRAMLLAQMMGLHREVLPSPLLFIEEETRARVHPEYMWLRIVQSDRYLSLLLGLPQGSLSTRFADREIVEGCTPLERMQRIDCLAAGYILQRKEAGTYDLANTHKIDKLLHKSSASIPSKWWLAPNLASSDRDSVKGLERTIRIIDQLTHYHLLVHLHLPYLLRSSTDHKYDYSKITAINASREVLMRFISFRGLNGIASFCRGINFLIFISCTVMCVAHIDAHCTSQARDRCGIVLDSLAHQRRGDRGMVELTVDSMKSIAYESNDAIASRMVDILTHLLSIEEDAFSCESHISNSLLEDRDNELDCGGKVSNCGHTLEIYIPHLGTIKIERRGSSDSVVTPSSPLPDQNLPTVFGSDSLFPRLNRSERSVEPSGKYGENTEQPIDAANLATTSCFGPSPAGKHWQAAPSYFSASHLFPSVSEAHDNSTLNIDFSYDLELINPARLAYSDDWLKQVVDMAQLENIF